MLAINRSRWAGLVLSVPLNETFMSAAKSFPPRFDDQFGTELFGENDGGR